MTDDGHIDPVRRALDPLPGVDGGVAVVLATSGVPPAIALLSSGDVDVDGTTVRAVTYGASSAANRLGGAFTLVVAAGEVTYRVEATQATVRHAGNLALLEGTLGEVRPTAEPPWLLELAFRRDPAADPQRAEGFVAYWSAVRRWLRSGAAGDPPEPAM